MASKDLITSQHNKCYLDQLIFISSEGTNCATKCLCIKVLEDINRGHCPRALDDFESECTWISDFWRDVSFSLYEGSKLTNWFFEVRVRLIIEKAIEEMSTATSLAMEPWHLPYLLWNETLPIIGTVYSTYFYLDLPKYVLLITYLLLVCSVECSR